MDKDKKISKKKLVVIISILSFILIGAFTFIFNSDMFMSDDEKNKIIVDTYLDKGVNAANKKAEKLYKFDKKKQLACKDVIIKNEKKKNLLEMAKKREESKPKLNDFEILDTKADVNDRGTYIYVTGSIKNNGKIPTRYYEIYVDYYDDNNNIVATDRTNSTVQLQPNATNNFKVMTSFKENMKNVKAYVHKVS